MGFIERLRWKRQEEDAREKQAATEEATRILEAARQQKIDEELMVQWRSENKPKWEKAKRQYEQSGLSLILKEVVNLRRAERIWEDSGSFDESFPEGSGRSFFFVSLVIEKTRKYHQTFYVGGHSDKITTKYLGIEVYEDGGMLFFGKKSRIKHIGNVAIKVPKAKWENNRGVLENALGKVYRHPRVAVETEIIGNPFFDRLKETGDLRQTIREWGDRFKPKA